MNPVAAITAVLLLLRACAADSTEGPDDVARDAALPPGADMGGAFLDASTGDSDMGVGENDRGGLYADPSRAADSGELGAADPGLADDAVASCFDGVDSDDDGAVDCADPDCASNVRSCCAGRGDCCAGDVSTAFFADPAALGSCASDPASCLAASAFGAPGPYVADGLSGGGDGVYDSGVLFEAAVDLDAERATLRGELALPADCAGGCMESVSFGFTRQPSLDGQSHVDPILALTLSPTRGEVSLRTGDRTLARFEGVAGEWAIHAAPDGTIGVESPTGSESIDARFAPAKDAHPVVWGHNANPSATADAGARLRSLTLLRALCDMPRAWEPATVVSDGSGPLPIAGRPSVATHGDEEWLAWASDGAIRFATRAAGESSWSDAGGLGGDELERYTHPELVTGSAGLMLVARREGADPGLVRAVDDGGGFGTPTLVLQASRIGATALDRPTMAIRNGAPALVMVARAHFGEETALHTFASSDEGESWEPRGVLALPALTDAEELGAPSLSVFNGAYLLYLPIRRGTRWRIAQLASDDFVHWRVVDDAALKSGSDQHAPLGARAPEAHAKDGGVELFYLGVDGIEPTPLRTWRPATDLAILPSG